jgi:hypothetical protein
VGENRERGNWPKEERDEVGWCFPLPRIFGTPGTGPGRILRRSGGGAALGPTSREKMGAARPGGQGATGAEGRDSQASRSGSFSGP